MNESALPDDVRRFVHEHVDTLQKLEVLLLLAGTTDRAWEAEAISAELRSSGLAVRTSVEGLLTSQLIEADGAGYRYRPRTPDLDAQVRRLADCYRERRTSVIALIFSRPVPSAVRTFADAFRIKKD